MQASPPSDAATAAAATATAAAAKTATNGSHPQQQQQQEGLVEPPGSHAALQQAAQAMKGRSVVSVRHLRTAEIVALLLAADELKKRASDSDPSLRSILQGKIVATAFFEPSTRTRCSFEAAALRLGAGVISNADLKAASSVKKGESLQDTMRMFASYADAVVMRHPDVVSCSSSTSSSESSDSSSCNSSSRGSSSSSDSSESSSSSSNSSSIIIISSLSCETLGSCGLVASSNIGFGSYEAPQINNGNSSSNSSSSSSSSSSVLMSGGDGSGEHPTQALLDLFTIAEANPQWFKAAAARALKGDSGDRAQEASKGPSLTVAFLGDLRNGRTVHSLALLLARLSVRLFFVSHKDLPPREDFISELRDIYTQQGLDADELCCCSESLESVLPLSDFLYVTRLQRERLNGGPQATAGAPGGPPLTEQGAPGGAPFLSSGFCVTRELLEKHAKPHLKLQGKRMQGSCVLHPLPRVDELSCCVDSTPFARYFVQAANGVYVRMALLTLALEGTHPFKTFQ
ncbi:hypothetical protein Emed_000995 [Eimeria media]